MTFDLDLWPTDLNINWGHLLIKDYLPTTLEACGEKSSWVINCTRWSRLLRPLTLTFDLLTWISIGVIYASRTIYLPSLKLVGKAFLSYKLHKVKEYRHTDNRPTDIPTYQPTDILTYRPTCATQFAPPSLKGGHNYDFRWMDMLDFICNGSIDLFRTGRERKIQNENIYLQRDWNSHHASPRQESQRLRPSRPRSLDDD